MPNRESQIRIILSRYKYLFEEEVGNRIALGPKSSDGYQSIWIPKYLPRGAKQNGLRLKDGVGFISILETVKSGEGEPVAYCYSFESDQYLCTTSCTITGQEDKEKTFWFHYDKEKDNIPHYPHVSILYRPIRYFSKPLKLDEFLFFIGDTFLEESAGVWSRKQAPIWASRL